MLQDNRDTAEWALIETLVPLIQTYIENGFGLDRILELTQYASLNAAFNIVEPTKRGKASKAELASVLGTYPAKIRNIQSLADHYPENIKGPNAVVKIIHAWTNDPDYSADSQPRVLPLTGDKSFTSLVKQYGRGVTPKSIQRLMTRFGRIRLTPEGEVGLLTNFDFEKTKEQEFRALKIAGAGLFNTFYKNTIKRNIRQRFQRSFTVNINKKHKHEIERKLHSVLSATHQKLREEYMKYELSPADNAGESCDIGFTLTYIEQT